MKIKNPVRLLAAGFSAGLSVLALSGCCMMLDEPQEPVTTEIIDRHMTRVNREQELAMLTGKAWVPTYIRGQEGTDGKNLIELPPEKNAFIIFKEDSTVHGYAGVNRFAGNYIIVAPNIMHFGALTTPLLIGPNLDYEMLFLAQVNEVDCFKFNDDGTLELYQRNILMLKCKPMDISEVEATVPQTAPSQTGAEPVNRAPAEAAADKDAKK